VEVLCERGHWLVSVQQVRVGGGRDPEMVLLHNVDAHTQRKRYRTCMLLKGTWQRGGFSGVFAEIGSA
jgi:hypothetical protein